MDVATEIFEPVLNPKGWKQLFQAQILKTQIKIKIFEPVLNPKGWSRHKF